MFKEFLLQFFQNVIFIYIFYVKFINNRKFFLFRLLLKGVLAQEDNYYNKNLSHHFNIFPFKYFHIFPFTSAYFHLFPSICLKICVTSYPILCIPVFKTFKILILIYAPFQKLPICNLHKLTAKIFGTIEI